jgi:hypothetical protein
MGGHMHYVAEVERAFPGEYVVDLSEIKTKSVDERFCYVTQRVFDAIGDYTNSLPTAPSSGRVYKRNQGWSRVRKEWDAALTQWGFTEDKPDEWYVYFVRNTWVIEDGVKKKFQDHHPFHLVIRKDADVVHA